MVNKFGLGFKAKLLLLGNYISDGACPEKWRTLSQGHLFISEKPYIQMKRGKGKV